MTVFTKTSFILLRPEVQLLKYLTGPPKKLLGSQNCLKTLENHNPSLENFFKRESLRQRFDSPWAFGKEQIKLQEIVWRCKISIPSPLSCGINFSNEEWIVLFSLFFLINYLPRLKKQDICIIIKWLELLLFIVFLLKPNFATWHNTY